MVLLDLNGSCPCFAPNLIVVTDMATPLLDNLTRGTQLWVKGPYPILAFASHSLPPQTTAQKYYPAQLPRSNKFQTLWIFSRIWPLMVPSNFPKTYKLLPVLFWQAVATSPATRQRDRMSNRCRKEHRAFAALLHFHQQSQL